jgi:MoaA/NifB/PqqE/SkfB family radical SAM enzyme
MRLVKLAKGIGLSKFGKKTPLVVINKVTFKCNLKCKYCGYWKTPRKDMTTEQCKRAISEFADAGCVYWEFTGGEPTIRKDIGDLIGHAKDCGLMVSVATNGLLVKKKAEALKKADFIHISFDGDKKVHETMRGKGTHKKSMGAIRFAIDNGINVYPETVLSKVSLANDFDSISKAVDFAESIGKRLTITFPYRDAYNWKNVDEITPTPEEMRAVTEFLAEKEKGGVVKVRRPYLDWCGDFGEGKKINCLAGKLFCELFPDGKVAHCLFHESEGIDGLKHGFVNAFKMLESKRCGCTVGYMEYNFLFSLNPKAILDRLGLMRNMLK